MDYKRNTTIDLMRIIGATLIVLHHYQQGTKMAFPYFQFFNGKFNFGYVVEMFFVISGMMAYRSIKKHSQMPSFKQFGGVLPEG